MNRYNNYGLASLHASNFNQNYKSDRHDDRASLSGSEDSNYGLYADTHKTEADIEEEANVALTSQTLNPDGTPKRPMNAFMIFARRRRPQVSSENQSMRTGEISKLLSKEWISMPSHEKQFYLEQAKQLKDSFNTKYPDYVYRRRPNNSRKRRRSDSNMRHSFMTDHSDELLGNGDVEVEGSSPVDSDEHVDNTAVGYTSTRPSHSVSQTFGNMSQARSEPPYSSLDHSTRQSYGSSERFMQPPRPLMQQPDVTYSYSQSQHASYPQGWPPRVERLQPTWLNDGQSSQRQAYSPSTPSSTWSNSSNGPQTPSSTSPNYFPTLTTPFYPGQQQQPSVAEYPSSSPQQHPISTPSPIYEPVSHANMMSKEYAPRVYSSTGATTIQLENSYSSTRNTTTPLSYSSRNLPRVQTTMDYPSPQPPSSSSSSGHGYQWSRQ